MIGVRILAYDKVDSTNDLLKAYARTLPNGSVVWALEQTKGRGRFGRRWHSPKGGLWFSTLFKPRSHSIEPHHYVVLFSVAIVRFLKKLGVKAKIKWPNDVYVDEKKIAGILVESEISGTTTEIVVGVGMNVNNEIPPELRDKGVSLKELIGRELGVAKVFNGVISKANTLYMKYMIKDKQKYLVRVWKGLQLLTPGTEVWVRVGLEEDEREATVVDVHPDALVLDFGDGEEKFSSVEVVRWKNVD